MLIKVIFVSVLDVLVLPKKCAIIPLLGPAVQR